MRRRTLLKMLALPAAAVAGGATYVGAARSQNHYYHGPVSDHFDGVRFFSPGQPQDKGFAELLRWHLGGGRSIWPEAFASPFQDHPPPRVENLRVALVGHATFLIQVSGLNIITDPVFSERASPFGFVGPRRANPPGIAFENLPPIDVVLVTHNHYDHLDIATLGRLWNRDRPRIIAPLGNDTIIREADPAIQVERCDWDDAIDLGEAVRVHCEPCNHWSARGMNDRRMALWCAYVIASPIGPIYHVADTRYGVGAVFRRVRERYGAPLLANLPIGAYEPRWFMKPQHMNPADAVKALEECGARTALGHHWGTFRLTNEGVDDPPRALVAALAASGLPAERFRALRPGETWMPD